MRHNNFSSGTCMKNVKVIFICTNKYIYNVGKCFRNRYGNVYPPCLNKHIYKFRNLRLFADNRDEMLKHRAIKLSI